MSNLMNTLRNHATPNITSPTRLRLIIAAMFAVIAVGIALPPLTREPAGVVDGGWGVESSCDQAGYSEPDGGMCWERSEYHLIIKSADGHEWRVNVSEDVFWGCFGRDAYPACAQRVGDR